MDAKKNYLNDISQYYKKQRSSLGLKQREVAEIIGVEVRTLQRFENEGSSLSIVPFVILTKLLHIPDSFLHDQFEEHLQSVYQERIDIMNFKDARKKRHECK